MKKVKPSDPAFPGKGDTRGDLLNCSGEPGISKREFFAAIALQGILAGKSPGTNAAAAKAASDSADELIKALNNGD